ncbi:hypothetical protein B0J18DRAFT_175240 [Chaetomium sp. MPI-SDFR-AT-0129]|nr:hypothetical protein B0J18DRAFT_175240 [Chaetomium sp. MPI-SDFR-AT-0129]
MDLYRDALKIAKSLNLSTLLLCSFNTAGWPRRPLPITRNRTQPPKFRSQDAMEPGLGGSRVISPFACRMQPYLNGDGTLESGRLSLGAKENKTTDEKIGDNKHMLSLCRTSYIVMAGTYSSVTVADTKSLVRKGARVGREIRESQGEVVPGLDPDPGRSLLEYWPFRCTGQFPWFVGVRGQRIDWAVLKLAPRLHASLTTI